MRLVWLLLRSQIKRVSTNPWGGLRKYARGSPLEKDFTCLSLEYVWEVVHNSAPLPITLGEGAKGWCQRFLHKMIYCHKDINTSKTKHKFSSIQISIPVFFLLEKLFLNIIWCQWHINFPFTSSITLFLYIFKGPYFVLIIYILMFLGNEL